MIVSLSLKKFARSSNLTTTGSSQFAPLSNERDVKTALAKLESLIDSATWCATPFGENDTHGSVERSKSPPLAAFPPVQRLNFACPVSDAGLIGGIVQVVPPLSEKPLRLPLAPPLDQRSCCQLPTRLLASARLTSTHGSTSALRNTVPVWGAPSHPAANGLGPLTSVRGSTAAAAVAGAVAAATSKAAKTVLRAEDLSMEPSFSSGPCVSPTGVRGAATVPPGYQAQQAQNARRLPLQVETAARDRRSGLLLDTRRIRAAENRPGSSGGPGRASALVQHAGREAAADLVDDSADHAAMAAAGRRMRRCRP